MAIFEQFEYFLRMLAMEIIDHQVSILILGVGSEVVKKKDWCTKELLQYSIVSMAGTQVKINGSSFLRMLMHDN